MKLAVSPVVESLENRLQFDGSVIITVPGGGGGGGSTSLYNKIAAYSSRGNGPKGICVGDFNKDGKQDIAFTNSSAGTIGVMLNAGNGTFSKAAIYTGVGSNLAGITTVDLNGDKILDLAYVGSDLGIMLGTTGGAFGASKHITVGNRPVNVAFGDFNKDGKYDLVTANALSNNVSTVLNKGAGAFSAAINSVAGDGPFGVTVADFTGDGKADLAISNMGLSLTGANTGARIMVGSGTGAFVAGKLMKTGTRPVSIASADLNKDGKLDLVTANGGVGSTDGQNTVSVLIGLGGGSFNARKNFEAGAGASCVAIGDFNADGKRDLIVTNYNASSVSLLKGDGAGNFSTLETITGATNNVNVALGDFNLDGKLDFATAGYGSASIGVYLHK